jgi:hypothetical protein
VDAFGLVLSEAAAMTLATASRAEQRKLTVILDEVKAAPFRPGDLQERDAQGRVNEVLVVGDWLVTYWPDHAVRELRVVRLEQVED